MSRFVMSGDVQTENFDWGSAGMRCAPPGTGCESFVVMDVRLDPGFFHAFHKHPGPGRDDHRQSGRVTQLLEGESTAARPRRLGLHRQGRRARLVQRLRRACAAPVVLAPAVGDGGYVAVDVSGRGALGVERR